MEWWHSSPCDRIYLHEALSDRRLHTVVTSAGQHCELPWHFQSTWAAQYNTRLLIKLTPKGVVFPFLFFSLLFSSCRDCGFWHASHYCAQDSQVYSDRSYSCKSVADKCCIEVFDYLGCGTSHDSVVTHQTSWRLEGTGERHMQQQQADKSSD